YKIALISAAALCVVVIGYYLSDGEPIDGTPAISAASDETPQVPGEDTASRSPVAPPTPSPSSTRRLMGQTPAGSGTTPGRTAEDAGDTGGSSALAARVRAMQQSSNRQPSSNRGDNVLFGSLAP